MLQMDLEDNETAMTSFDTQVEELKGIVESLEAQLAQNQNLISDMEAKLEESTAQVTKKNLYLELKIFLSALNLINFLLPWRDDSTLTLY